MVDPSASEALHHRVAPASYGINESTRPGERRAATGSKMGVWMRRVIWRNGTGLGDVEWGTCCHEKKNDIRVEKRRYFSGIWPVKVVTSSARSKHVIKRRFD